MVPEFDVVYFKTINLFTVLRSRLKLPLRMTSEAAGSSGPRFTQKARSSTLSARTLTMSTPCLSASIRVTLATVDPKMDQGRPREATGPRSTSTEKWRRWCGLSETWASRIRRRGPSLPLADFSTAM